MVLLPVVMVKQVVNLVMVRESCKDIVNTADTRKFPATTD